MATITLDNLVGMFLTHSAKTNSANGLRSKKRYLLPLAEYLYGLDASKVKKHNITCYLDAHPSWGDASRFWAITAIHAMLNWGVEEELLDTNHLRGRLKKPRQQFRGKDVYITHEQFLLLYAYAADDFKKPLEFMYECWARPQDVYQAEAHHYNRQARMMIYPQHKTAKKTGDRHLVLSHRAVPIVEELIVKHPTGKLFRQHNGSDWIASRMGERMRQARKKAGLPSTIICYSGRHSGITDSLLAGNGDTITAATAGLTNTQMLHLAYSHVGDNASAKLAAMDKTRG